MRFRIVEWTRNGWSLEILRCRTPTKNVAMSILHCYHKLKDDHIEAIIHEGLYDLGT